jgi:hypothetical protein
MPRVTQVLDALARDARYALRTLRKSPVFTATAVLTLAVGIGANAAIFSMVDALLLRSLPYPEPERLALVSTVYRTPDQELHELSLTGATWEAVRDHAERIDAAPFSDWVTGVNLFADGRASNVDQQRVGAGFFGVLGVRAALGRSFTTEEDVPQGPAVAVLSHGLWARAFGADPDVLGRSILLRGEPHTVVGVMPEGFRSTAPAEVWTPMRASTTGEGAGQNYRVLVRLRPGVSWQEAEAEVDPRLPFTSFRRLGEVAAEALAHQRFLMTLVASLAAIAALLAALGIHGLVAHTVLERTRELGIRLALGSTRARALKAVTVPGVVLAAVGVVLGTGLALASSRVLAHFLWGVSATDPAVLAAGAGALVLLAAAASLVPGLRVLELDPARTLREE